MSSHSPVILCVEDDVDTQEMMSVMLTVWGYEAKLAGTAAEALRLIREAEPAAVLLDNSLPDCTGIQLCGEVRRFDQGLPIIFLSGSAHAEEQRLALESGANAFVSKPFAMDELFGLLNTYAPL
jgi:two-component system, OmpR family, response regulator